MSHKLLVLGHVNGHLEAAFKKVAALHAKNHFSCVIATGNLFSEDADSTDEQVARLLAGQISVAVPIYFTVGTRPLPPRVVARIEETAEEGAAELCTNLHYLGKHAVTKTVEGLRIVALGGLLDDRDVAAGQPSQDLCLPFHSVADEKSLRGAHSADILLTAIWPRGITRRSHVALPAGLVDAVDAVPSSAGVADLVATLRPRYHLTATPPFSSSSSSSSSVSSDDIFYEREGFFHGERPDSSHSLAIDVTRFLSLAAFGNTAKAKAMYAFVLTNEPATIVPAGCTPSPFPAPGTSASSSGSRKRGALEADPYNRFLQDNGHAGRTNGGRGNHSHNNHNNKNKRSRRNSPPPGPDRCFFCLSNPNLSTHMVCSIGNDAYLTTAKGPLPTASTFAEQGLHFPGHMLIVPLSHAATLTAEAVATPEQPDGAAVAASTRAEMHRFRKALQAMVASRSNGKLGVVVWEISRARNIHVHWQVVPVPAAMVHQGLVEAAFRVEAANLEMPKLEEDNDDDNINETKQGDDENQDYFRIWIWAEDRTEGEGSDGEKIVGKTLVMRLDPTAYFDLQYGRRVLAKLMDLDARLVWQECSQTEAEEIADVEAFRKAFQEWDFTLKE